MLLFQNDSSCKIIPMKIVLLAWKRTCRRNSFWTQSRSRGDSFRHRSKKTTRTWPILLFIADQFNGKIGELGWCSRDSARLSPLWSGFDSRTRRHMWIEFVVGSRHALLRRFFSGFSGFLPSTKTYTPNSNSIRKWGPQVCQLCCWCHPHQIRFDKVI